MRQITLVAAMVTFCGAISAQVDKSNLTGIVRDGTGAAIPAVTIKLASLGAGAVHSETSDASGFYRFTLIDRGVYRLDAEHAGVKRFRRDSVGLQTGESTTIDIALTLGEVAESVTVHDHGGRQRVCARPSPGNAIPAQRFDPVAVNALKYYLLPNRTPASGSLQNFENPQINGRKWASVASRVDHQITANQSLFFPLWMESPHGPVERVLRRRLLPAGREPD